MAAGNFIVYSSANADIDDATIDLTADTFRMILTSSGYTPNQDTHTAYSDVSANELAATGGYSTYGKLLTQSLTQPGTTNISQFDADDQTWSSATFTAKWAVIVRDADANGTLVAGDLLLAYGELEAGGTVSPSNGDLVVTINANGIFRTTAATS